MPDFAKKSLLLFFSIHDETLFELELRAALPAIGFIDGSIWESASPPVKDSLADCRSRVVFLWDRSASPDLPFQALSDGRARGPTSGVVIQFIRSSLQEGILTSGDIGIGYDKNNAPIVRFVKTVWKIAKAMSAGSLDSFDWTTGDTLEKGIRDYVVGPGAVELGQSGTTLKHCAADVYYRVERKS